MTTTWEERMVLEASEPPNGIYPTLDEWSEAIAEICREGQRKAAQDALANYQFVQVQAQAAAWLSNNHQRR